MDLQFGNVGRLFRTARLIRPGDHDDHRLSNRFDTTQSNSDNAMFHDGHGYTRYGERTMTERAV